jgi:membrane-bound serine protease (ClpP class)
MVAFGLGLLCVAIEIFFFPGIAVLALTGIVLILGSLVWAMADLWPHEPLTVAWSADAFAAPVMNLGLGMLIALALALALARFIPKGWFFTRLAVAEGASGAAQRAGVAPEVGRNVSSLVGRTAVAATGLYPSGQIEIDGRRYEARLEVGSASPGTRVVVRRSTDFGLVVDREEGAPS